MSNSVLRIPSYRRHKPSWQAVVSVGGRDIYLGKWNSAASRAEYNRIIAEWSAHGGTLPAPSNDRTVGELLAAFLAHALRYHRRPDGKPSTELASYKQAMRHVKALYSRVPIADFGPMALKAVRQRLVEAGLARVTINRQVNRIRHIFKWGVENELVPPAVLQALQAVAGLRYGRSDAREVEPVKPVPELFVDAVLAHVAPQVAAMIDLQRVTGMRSGEVTIMRGADINTAGKVWVYCPESHKSAWRGHERKVYLGPKSAADRQAISEGRYVGLFVLPGRSGKRPQSSAVRSIQPRPQDAGLSERVAVEGATSAGPARETPSPRATRALRYCHLLSRRGAWHRRSEPGAIGGSQSGRHRRRSSRARASLASAPIAPQRGDESAPRAWNRSRPNNPWPSFRRDHGSLCGSRSRKSNRSYGEDWLEFNRWAFGFATR